MNRPAGTVAAWWANPLDIDANHPCIPLPRDREAQSLNEPFRARFARVMRSERQPESAPAGSR
jgi:hypothetical protein